ncbi:hypothetical protein C3V36_00520 [Lachnospiraceae bacterium oral taxon 500]|nr:hypothetical protein C3V36_00520 [Lachnospiraceae bacterium oral taxon 500]
MRIMLSGSSGLIFVIWMFVTFISVISSIKKKNQTKNGSWPNNQRPSWNPGNQPNMQWPPQNANTPEFEPNSDAMSGGSAPMQRAQWDNAKIRQQMSRFQGNSVPEPQPVLKNQGNESSFTDSYPEEESYLREEEFQRRSDVFIQPMPMERVEEYVPEEFGEAGSTAEDNFYSSKVIQSSLHDEGDIAREKAYQSKHKEAFKQQKAKKQSRFSGVLARGNSMKKAILLSEILAEPKALKEGF